MQNLKINNFSIDDNSPCFIIAEVAQAHDGSFGFAHSFIDLVANTGANAIKFQTHIAREESTINEQFRVNFSYQDKTRYDYWKRMEFSPEQWQDLSDHAKSKGLIFLSSPFSVKAVDILEDINIPAWKIGSGELRNYEMLEAIAKTNKPVLISSGMSDYSELKFCINFLKDLNPKVKIGLFQCTTEYPTDPKNIGLNVIKELKEKFAYPVGLSDHSGDIVPSIAAIALGANIIEVHICFDKYQFGPDSTSSLNRAQLLELCRARDLLHVINTNLVNKNKFAKKLSKTSKTFSRSIALSEDCSKGTILTRKMLTFKKPGGGIDYENLELVIGKKLSRDVPLNRLLTLDDLE